MARRFLAAICVLVLWSGAGLACVYPAPVRSVTATLLTALNGSGQLANAQRTRLAQAMAQIAPEALSATLSGEVPRRDARAVDAVLAVAEPLARGIGTTVPEAVRTPLNRVRAAVLDTCATDNAVQTGDGLRATDSEHGTSRNEGGGGRALTFGEGVARLSLTFTIYMTFVAFLLGVRRLIKDRAEATPAPDDFASEHATLHPPGMVTKAKMPDGTPVGAPSSSL